MTSKFAEAAIQYVKETDYIDDLNRNLAGNAFIAGAELGYRVGKDERPTKDEIADTNIENGFLREERDQLKQQLEFAQGRQEHWFKEAMEVRGEANQLRTRLEDAEKALKFYAAQSEPAAFAYLADTGDTARSYFKKHPQDSAKGDL